MADKDSANGAENGAEEASDTLEEITMAMLEQLGASVRPARHVPNAAALKWILDMLASAEPPEELNMEWFSLGDAEAAELAEALKTNTTVKVLKLRYNEIRDAGAGALAGALHVHPALETVLLGNNLIGNAGAEQLAGAVSARGIVSRLDLRYNQMGPELPEAFCGMTCLTALDIRANRLTCLPTALGAMTNLKELVVERNHDLEPKSFSAPNLSPAELLELIRTQNDTTPAA